MCPPGRWCRVAPQWPAVCSRPGSRLACQSAMGSQISSATSMTQIRSGLRWIARRTHFAGADADRVVEPVVRFAVGHVKQRPDDLAAFQRVGTAVAVPLHHDHGPVVGLDDSPEVRPERTSRALFPGEVGSAEPAACASGADAAACRKNTRSAAVPVASSARVPAARRPIRQPQLPMRASRQHAFLCIAGSFAWRCCH